MVSLGRHLTLSTATLRNCLRARNQYCLGNCSGKGWIPSSRTPNVGLFCARNFSTGLPRRENRVCLSKELREYLWQEQKRFFRRDSMLMGVGKKKLPRDSSKFAPDSSGSSSKSSPPDRRPCRQPYERQKPCPPMEKCIPPSPPCCRRRPKNPKCPNQPPPPCPPPCPTPCPKPVKAPPPKICYRKCPPPPKLPKLPKHPKIPAPPPPPPLPKIPRPPKCPAPCPPPPPPPLPKCPKAPKCPECPAQRECPPPPPCEPCPCPPPCPPPCCPPPPPCPPCPPPIPCPKPLPCPPPPPPRVCPPCPPCPECPEPPPCPPPPPCCPCPCPKPPPPCPCPKPCPPCKQVEASCPEDVPSCPKNSGNSVKKRKMSTYHAPPRFLSLKNNRFRRLHVSSLTLGKSSKSGKSSNCKDLGDICEQGKKSGSCVKTCQRERDCGGKKHACGDQPKMDKKKKKSKKKKKEVCPETCIPKGKCEQSVVAAPPKMVYGTMKCPTPKFASPTPCPEVPKGVDEDACLEIRTVSKPKKEVCVPPPLPGPPTDPVILCPCPPPPKKHPGPCPCYDIKKDTYVKSTLPPCPVKEKYACCKESLYCPPQKLICKKENKCDDKKKKKEKRKKRPTS